MKINTDIPIAGFSSVLGLTQKVAETPRIVAGFRFGFSEDAHGMLQMRVQETEKVISVSAWDVAALSDDKELIGAEKFLDEIRVKLDKIRSYYFQKDSITFAEVIGCIYSAVLDLAFTYRIDCSDILRFIAEMKAQDVGH